LGPIAARGQRTSGKLVARKAPAEEALDALEDLQGSGLGAKEIYDGLSQVLRVYLERRYDIPALVLTTPDLLRMMRQRRSTVPWSASPKDLFARCDLVKFAKLIPEPPELRNDIEAAIQIVRATAPKPPPEPEPSMAQPGSSR